MAANVYEKRWERPRQEISCFLRYFLFFTTFALCVISWLTCTLGIYLYAKEFRPVRELVDLILNPCILLISVGACSFAVCFLGCAGALRQHVCMLKLFSLTLFMAYICLVIVGFLAFILFYSDSSTGVSLRTLLTGALCKYHTNDNVKDIVDYVQAQLHCCGVGAQGYQEWSKNALYNCSDENAAPERCGVPYSCCRQQERQRGSNDPTPLVSVMCGFGAQEKPVTELVKLIHSDGCLQPLQKAFEGNAVILGAAVGAVVLPVCLLVTLSNLLAKQITKQRYLLERQARREERRLKRQRQRFRDPFSRAPPSTTAHHYDELVEAPPCDVIKLTQEDILQSAKDQQVPTACPRKSKTNIDDRVA